MGEFTGVAGQFVAGPRAAALQVPVDPRATAYEGPKATGDEAASLEIKVDGHMVRLIPTHESVRHVVGTAYLIGGFGLVLSLQAEVRRRVALETLTLDQLRSAVRAIVEEKRKRPQYASSYDRASSDQMAAMPRAQARLQIASDVLRLLLEAWARIAAAEEQVLREYEPKLIIQFVNLAKDARSIALREWLRYEPYDTTVTDVLALSTSEAKERSMVDLRLRKEAVELVKAVHGLHECWKAYLDALDSSQKVAAMGARKLSLLNPGSNPAEQVRYSRLYVADKFAAFDGRRSEIGTQFPAALQVYGKLGKLSGSDLGKNEAEIERWVIAALIEAVDSSQELGYQALMHPLFKAGERLRVEPSEARARGSSRKAVRRP